MITGVVIQSAAPVHPGGEHYGNYWDGGHWRDRDYWHRNY
ncbi:DUF2502 domain-containing protein, partial [Escherichia coli]|nr:DUF2502 domain-containing protein [Escherichia coli]